MEQLTSWERRLGGVSHAFPGKLARPKKCLR